MSALLLQIHVIAVILYRTIDAQQEESFYSFDFEQQSSDWIQNNGSYDPSVHTFIPIKWFNSTRTTRCPRAGAGESTYDVYRCVRAAKDAYISRTISTSGYHSIRLQIDVSADSVEAVDDDWCIIQYRTATTNWINDNVIQGVYNYVLDYNVDIPDNNVYNNQESFEVKIGIAADTGGDNCFFDNLKLFGIPYIETPTLDSNHPTENPSRSPLVEPLTTLIPTHTVSEVPSEVIIILVTESSAISGPETSNDVELTLYFDVIYKYMLSTDDATTLYTIPISMFAITGTHSCKVPKIRFINYDSDGIYIDKIQVITTTGTWFGIEARCIDDALIAAQPRVSDAYWLNIMYEANAGCASSGTTNTAMCIDNEDPSTYFDSCSPYKQNIYFDLNRPNQYIDDAIWEDALVLTNNEKKCINTEPTSSPTSNPTSKPTKPPTDDPTKHPTDDPTKHPTTPAPTAPDAMICGEHDFGAYNGEILEFRVIVPHDGDMTFDASNSNFYVTTMEAYMIDDTNKYTLLQMDNDDDQVIYLNNVQAGNYLFALYGDQQAGLQYEVRTTCTTKSPTRDLPTLNSSESPDTSTLETSESQTMTAITSVAPSSQSTKNTFIVLGFMGYVAIFMSVIFFACIFMGYKSKNKSKQYTDLPPISKVNSVSICDTGSDKKGAIALQSVDKVSQKRNKQQVNENKVSKSDVDVTIGAMIRDKIVLGIISTQGNIVSEPAEEEEKGEEDDDDDDDSEELYDHEGLQRIDANTCTKQTSLTPVLSHECNQSLNKAIDPQSKQNVVDFMKNVETPNRMYQ